MLRNPIGSVLWRKRSEGQNGAEVIVVKRGQVPSVHERPEGVHQHRKARLRQLPARLMRR